MPYFPQRLEEFNFLRHLMLMYGNAKTPWRSDELRYYVAHFDHTNKPDDWLFDSFLFLNVKAASGNDFCADVNLGTTMSGEGDFFSMVSPQPATKDEWEELLEFFLGSSGAVQTLDTTIDKLSQEIHHPYETKRNVVLMLPYPHISQERFGVVGGRNLNFSIKNQNLTRASEQRLAASTWFVDRIVERFAALSVKHVHLLGVYWMFETVFRGWDVDDHWLLKELRRHIRSHNLKFLWIPFWSRYNLHLLEHYRDYYFDLAFLQPNYMFYEKIRGVEDAARAARKRGAGIEMEYYLELNEPIKIQDERHSRFRDYLNGGVTYGYMTKAACAHFHGIGSLERMQHHENPLEREFYDDIYRFTKGEYRIKPSIPRRTRKQCTGSVLAVDLGGTNLRAALVDECGSVLVRKSVPTPTNRQEILRQMVFLLRDVHAHAGTSDRFVHGIGVSTGGRVDFARGYVVDSTALLPGWGDLPLRDILEREMHLPVVVDNDGNCAAIAEHLFGEGRDCSDFIVLVLGTGIGGGIVMDDEVIRGTAHAAAELGHFSIDHRGVQCSCGNRGCVELYASGSGLARLASEAMGAGTLVIAGVSPENVTAEIVGDAARNGNRRAAELIVQAGSLLGGALAGLINAFNPERIILSGSLLALGDMYLNPMRETAHARAMKTAAASTELVLSTLRDGALLGAAGLAFQRARAE